MNKMGLTEMLTYSTVLIQCEYNNGTSGCGTGFIINICTNKETKQSVPVIITNDHVVNNSKKTVFEFCKADENGHPMDKEPFRFIYSGKDWVHHPDSNVDLRCLPLGPTLNRLKQDKIRIFYIPIDIDMIPSEIELESLLALEEIIMIGYPIGLSDTYNHKPIIRRGITATHPKNDYQGKKEILVDMACFPGSSGSPVFILNQGAYPTSDGIAMGNRIKLLGVLYGGPQYNAQGVLTFGSLPNTPRPMIQMPINLGVIIKSQRILEFQNFFRGRC